MAPAGVTEAKAALRRQLAQLPRPDWSPLLERFLSLPEVDRARTVLLFYGVGREPDTRGLITTLLQRGKTVVLPRCLPRRQMEARCVTGLDDLTPGSFQIPEPGEHCPAIDRAEIDLILVPNLCCDRLCYRLGHGGGYYDRYLAGYTGVTVALCPEARLQERLPRDEYDLPVGLVLTETETRRETISPAPHPEESAVK